MDPIYSILILSPLAVIVAIAYLFTRRRRTKRKEGGAAGPAMGPSRPAQTAAASRTRRYRNHLGAACRRARTEPCRPNYRGQAPAVHRPAGTSRPPHRPSRARRHGARRQHRRPLDHHRPGAHHPRRPGSPAPPASGPTWGAPSGGGAAWTDAAGRPNVGPAACRTSRNACAPPAPPPGAPSWGATAARLLRRGARLHPRRLECQPRLLHRHLRRRLSGPGRRSVTACADLGIASRRGSAARGLAASAFVGRRAAGRSSAWSCCDRLGHAQLQRSAREPAGALLE